MANVSDEYTRYEGYPDHKFAAYLRDIDTKWDYETCGASTIFFKTHPTEKAKYETIAVVSYNNKKLTKTVMIPNKYRETFEKRCC